MPMRSTAPDGTVKEVVTETLGDRPDVPYSATLITPDTIPGFLSIEKSSSLSKDNYLLSLCYWADEAVLVQWSSTGEHHAAQQAGRDGIFADYRLRVGPALFENLKAGDVTDEPHSRYNRPPFHSRRYMSLAKIDGVTDPRGLEESPRAFTGDKTIP